MHVTISSVKKMKNKPEPPKRITTQENQDNNAAAVLKRIVLEDVPMKNRVAEANKPMYLTRYE